MSVLNQSGEEQVECPLCMEPLEVDDLNFFPCTCGYQICRFCWHRIRLDENGGLCPACRKAYSENPADFIPLSREQVAKLKAEKKQRIQQKKAQQSESRKHLASVRVVQRNLVFVVGLPPRLADPEILKRHEYFGKFGKIHKVVINQSTSYAGSQGPSASAYVTYLKSDDALRAIQAVNNVTIDNRVIKSSLGTTKYCSHFMKNQPCPKGDCMYLHEYGDPEASFTREQMHLGKHQEYEKKLHEELVARSKAPAVDSKTTTTTPKAGIPTVAAANGVAAKESSAGTNKENWPQLDKDKKQEKGRKGKTKTGSERTKKEGKGSGSESRSSEDSRTTSTSSTGSSQRTNSISKADGKDTDTYPSPELSSEPSPACSPPLQRSSTPSDSSTTTNGSSTSFAGKLPTSLVGKLEDNHSYFSASGFALDGAVALKDAFENEERLNSDMEPVRSLNESLQDESNHQLLTDVLPNINTTEDWAAAFGFAASQSREHELLQSKLHQQQRDVGKLCDFLPIEPTEPFAKGRDGFSGFYEMSKFQENLMDALANKTNGFHVRPPPEQPQTHLSNGLEQNMSKFFSDFHKYNSKQETPSLSPSPYQNGFNGLHNTYQHILQQKQLEEQFRNLGLKQQNFSGAQTTVYQNGIPNSAYTNGDMSLLNGGGIHNVYSKPQGVSSSQTNNPRNSEAELDFDPFQETQKALAELMAAEQIHKSHNSGLHAGRSGHTNGLIHSQNGSHIPPPPPGFVQQQQTHMNSFGSKILPFLSMSNSQQQINHQINSNSSVSNNWPSSSLSSQIQQQQQKNISNTCNDWKVLDPAILRSSQSFQLSQQMAPSMSFQQQQQQINNHQQPPNGLNLRSFDYPTTNGAFSAFAQQLPPSFNAFTPPAQTNLNWFAANDVSAQISSPPGFRNGQTTKQQEC